MKFISFNINGLRAHFHQLLAIINQHKPDVLALQETKVHDDLFPLKEIKKLGYNAFFYGKKKHHGVALLTKKSITSIHRNLLNNNIDMQYRLVIAEIPSVIGNITVINGYFPQGENRNHPIKFPEKKRFYENLQKYLEIELKKNLVLIMGDMNVSPTNLDVGIGEKNFKRWLSIGKCSFLPEERNWINNLLKLGLIDIFRKAHPYVWNRFSWFDYRSKSFNDNRGLRIDLLLASKPLANRCIETNIDYKIRGMERPSDHAPVWASFSL